MSFFWVDAAGPLELVPGGKRAKARWRIHVDAESMACSAVGRSFQRARPGSPVSRASQYGVWRSWCGLGKILALAISPAAPMARRRSAGRPRRVLAFSAPRSRSSAARSGPFQLLRRVSFPICKLLWLHSQEAGAAEVSPGVGGSRRYLRPPWRPSGRGVSWRRSARFEFLSFIGASLY